MNVLPGLHQRNVAPVLILVLLLLVPVRGSANVIRNVPVGPIEFIPLGATPNNLISARVSGARHPDLIVSYDSPLISVIQGSVITTVDLPFAISLLAPVGRPGTADLLACVPVQTGDLHLLAYNPADDSFSSAGSMRLAHRPYVLQAADVTGNGLDDLLLLLQDQNGVAMIRNLGDGSFGEVEMIFEDVLVSDFQVLDLNGDGINDFILYDPIKNLLRVHYGFGQTVFSLERQHPLPESLNLFRAVPFIDESIYDLVAVYPETRNVHIYMGDGFGRYSRIQSHSLTSRVNSILFVDLFGNDRPDLVVAERETGIVRLYRNAGKLGFDSAGAIQLDRGIRDLTVVSDGSGERKAVCLLDVRNDRLIILRLLPAVSDFLPTHLALGSEPSDMVVANLFGGELPELYVLCQRAGTISVYWFDRAFRLTHTMVDLPGNPDRLYVHRGPLGRTKLVVSDRESDFITVVSIHWERFEANIYGIPAAAGSDVIHLGLSRDDTFQFSTFTTGRGDAVLSLYEQIGSDEYIERTVSPIEEDRMLALDVVDISGNELVDMVYVYRRAGDPAVYMASAFSDREYVFRRKGAALALPDTAATRGFLLSENSGSDGPATLLVYLDRDGEAGGRLYRVRADREGGLTLLGERSGGKVVPSAKSVQLVQLPGNPFPDVVYYNAMRGRIETNRSAPDGSFMDTQGILAIDDIGSFAVYSEPMGAVQMLVVGRKGSPYVSVVRIDE
jgi:hypothetical protein